MSSQIPAELRYTDEHEWAQRTADTTIRVGITDYAQSALGDVVYVQLPELGSVTTFGDQMGEIESTKSVSDLYAPIAGTVTAVNVEVDSNPELVNSDPYGAGWLIEISVDSVDELDRQLGDTLDAAGYSALIGD